jgi:hypothetical protein
MFLIQIPIRQTFRRLPLRPARAQMGQAQSRVTSSKKTANPGAHPPPKSWVGLPTAPPTANPRELKIGPGAAAAATTPSK